MGTINAMTRLPRFAAVLVVALTLVACDDDPSGFPTMGMPGIPSPTKLGAT